jgi:hypothetical protein
MLRWPDYPGVLLGCVNIARQPNHRSKDNEMHRFFLRAFLRSNCFLPVVADPG